MTHKQVYKVTDNQLIITLPEIFRNKSVTVTIDDGEINKKENLSLKDFLLSGPEMTDETYKYIQEKRNHFNEWK